MNYRHCDAAGKPLDLPVGKIVCVGRNYAAHAAELNNEVPSSPILFMKPATSLAALADPVRLPIGRGACHFETEIAVLVGERMCHASADEALAAVAGYGIGLDLTLRDVQNTLKEKGHPWERAKAFDGACPLSVFVSPESIADPAAIGVRMRVNDELRQDGNSSQMLFPIAELLAEISAWFSLGPGDVVLTGTPAGVGALQPGDRLCAELVGVLKCETRVFEGGD